MVQKIVVIGSAGMLGRELMKVFPDSTGLAKQDLDIGKPEEVRKALEVLKPEIVINSAAYTNVVESENKDNLTSITEINGMGPGYLADACKFLNAKLVHISTDYVFDGEKKEGYSEIDQTNPMNEYGKSKLLGEEEIKKKMQNFYIIRTSSLFGDGKNNIVTKILEALEKNEEIEAIIERQTKPTYAKDLAHSLKAIIEKEPGIYHIANETIWTPYRLITEIMRLTKRPKRVRIIPENKYDHVKRPKYGILLNNKADKLRPVEKAIEEFIKSRSN